MKLSGGVYARFTVFGHVQSKMPKKRHATPSDKSKPAGSREQVPRSDQAHRRTFAWSTCFLSSLSTLPWALDSLASNSEMSMESQRSQRFKASLFAGTVSMVVVGGLCTIIVVGLLQVYPCMSHPPAFTRR